MFCSSCGERLLDRSKICPSCGKKHKKSKVIPLLLLLSFITMIAVGITLFINFDNSRQSISVSEQSHSNETTEKIETPNPLVEPKSEVVALPAEEIKEEVKKDITAIIAESQTKVFTIYTDRSQGSGFLMDQYGDIVTNSHVVEGYVWVSVTDSSGINYNGQVIGYSNDTDIAVIRVPELAGKASMPLETSQYTLIGEEVIALGSPQGLGNTATLGYLTGVNRSFYIGQRSYENIYQMSAPISPGSSGGPLLSKETGKAIAINSAKIIGEEAIGFSIPIVDIYPILQSWIQQPLTEQEVINLFYNQYGNYYYDDLWENEEDWHFDGGDYNEEEDMYYDIPDEWANESYDHDSDENDTDYDESDEYLEDQLDEDFESYGVDEYQWEQDPGEYNDNDIPEEILPNVQEEMIDSEEDMEMKEEIIEPSIAE
jgi:serine protease Do